MLNLGSEYTKFAAVVSLLLCMLNIGIIKNTFKMNELKEAEADMTIVGRKSDIME